MRAEPHAVAAAAAIPDAAFAAGMVLRRLRAGSRQEIPMFDRPTTGGNSLFGREDSRSDVARDPTPTPRAFHDALASPVVSIVVRLFPVLAVLALG